ncbi:MAG: tRNA 2-thiouridine(34) synthase MnmA [Patescibacteria group bacterium]|nr:tRNA 2-thiouridine(34) synthase MnmA [Patescibacteria group bacterium]
MIIYQKRKSQYLKNFEKNSEELKKKKINRKKIQGMDKIIRRKNAQKVVVAMSGGLDSSVAAALLKRAGFNVVGVFMKLWTLPTQHPPAYDGSLVSEKNSLIGTGNRCCFAEAEARARKVAKILKIPFYVFNFEKEFKKRIVDYFLQGYKKGITPNPCVVCNKEIKFGLLLEKTLKLDADFVATGHYARLKEDKKGIHLFRGRDKKKDQSYFLWQLNQKQLRYILFPLGNYTKDKVRALAKKFNLPVFGIPESMEICFIRTTLNDFLARHLKSRPGPILTIEGKKIGQHRGLPFYTIGQRKGIELPGGPFYVVAKDLKKNTLIVTPFFRDKKLYSKSLIAKNVNWLSGKEPKLPLKIKAQIRYGHEAVTAAITKKLKNGKIELVFASPQRAVTPGQSVVFFKGKEVLGGGIIC